MSIHPFAELKWVKGNEVRFELVMPNGIRIPHTVRYNGILNKVAMTERANSTARERWANMRRLNQQRTHRIDGRTRI